MSGGWDDWGGEWKSEGEGQWESNKWGGEAGSKRQAEEETTFNGKKMRYGRELRGEHEDQMAMWQEMHSRIKEASESQIHGALEAAHAAIEVQLSSGDGRLLNNGQISRIIEDVLKWSTAVHLRGFFFKLSGKLGYLLTQRTASRVLETLFKQCQNMLKPDVLQKSADEEDATGLPTLQALFNGAVTELVEGDEERGMNLLDVIMDSSGSYALRTLVHVLAGQVPPAKDYLPPVKMMEPLAAGGPLARLGTAILEHLASGGILVHRLQSTPAAALVGVLASVWSDAPMVNMVTENYQELAKTKVGSRVLETAMDIPEVHKNVHDWFIANWAELVTSGHQFPVRKWVASCPRSGLKSILAALREGHDVIYNKWATNIVSAAAEAAAKDPSSQAEAVKVVCECLKVQGSLYDALIGMGAPVGLNILGALLSCGTNEQTMPLFKGVAGMTPDQAIPFLTVVAGSKMFEHFVSKAKEKELKKFSNQMKGSFLRIAQSSSSAVIVIEKLYEVLPLGYRKTIAEELSQGLKQLQGNYCTKKTVKKLRLEQFKHRFEDWEAAERKEVKKMKLISNILGITGDADPSVLLEDDEQEKSKGKGRGKGKEKKAEEEEKSKEKKQKKKKAKKD